MPQYLCQNPDCQKIVNRYQSKIEPSGHIFCSHHCAATITNQNRADPKQKCANPNCQNLVTRHDKSTKFCSNNCASKIRTKSKEFHQNRVLHFLRQFIYKNNRIPLKIEAPKYYRPARQAFGSWNKAIEAAGYDPNPVKFAKHYLARDGHKCDSLTEKILDDWLSSRNIDHEHHVPYPFNNGMKSDFKIKDYWVELFGLQGEQWRYDELKSKKLSLIQQYDLNLISLGLRDIYSRKILEAKLKPILTVTNY